MIGNKEFFENLREGDEYINCFMTKEAYHGIHHELRERIVVNTVRQNGNFKNDDIHKDLVKKVSKAKKDLIDYEFNKNHNR